MTIPNSGYAPWILTGAGGITISQTGIHVTISGNQAGGNVLIASGTVGGGLAPGWAGPHPGFADAIVYNGVGDYTLTLLSPQPEFASWVTLTDHFADPPAAAPDSNWAYSRPSPTEIRVLMGITGVPAELDFDVMVFGTPP